MTLVNKKSKSAENKKNDDLKGNKKILDNVWGESPQGEITAIMGPSGAGKTSLLNILAGRARSNGNVFIDADVRLNNVQVDPTKSAVRSKIAFVAQDDAITATSTPREAIRFSAKLRLPRNTSEVQIESLVDGMISALGLSSCADTMVGNAMIKGISGGERKRTSVGIELVTKPAMVFLDEPTSGLDSFSALQLVDVLHKVARAGASVLFTIHQPASEIFNSFDHLILLNKGLVMYRGSVAAVPSYFSERNFPVPQNYNPADWIMSVAQQNSIADLTKSGFFDTEPSSIEPPTRVSHLQAEGKIVNPLGISLHDDSSQDTTDIDKILIKGDYQHVSFATQTRVLYKREFTNLKRDKGSLIARFGITIFLNLLFGLIFKGVGEASNDVMVNTQSHFGAFVMCLMSAMFGAGQPALFGILEDRPIFLREYATHHYSMGPYFAARFTIELILSFFQTLVAALITYWLIGLQSTFFMYVAVLYTLGLAASAVALWLGSIAGVPKIAQELLPILYVPQMLFAGFFVATSLIPVWLRWVQYVCFLTYAIRIGLLAEFESCANDVTNPLSAKNCQTILDSTSAKGDQKWLYWMILFILFAAFRLCALYVLRSKSKAFV
jgi:ABC-type multidrug transport system ATPase subunit